MDPDEIRQPHCLGEKLFSSGKRIKSPRRGWFQIIEGGRDLHKKGHERIDVKILNQFPESAEFQTTKTDQPAVEVYTDTSTVETPEETLQKAYINILVYLASELLERIKAKSPQFFERLVVNALVVLGYGGTHAYAGRSIGQSGDEGIDGIIKKDHLGLDVIYLQAKNWEGTVGRPEIHKFVGALHGIRAKIGCHHHNRQVFRCCHEIR